MLYQPLAVTYPLCGFLTLYLTPHHFRVPQSLFPLNSPVLSPMPSFSEPLPCGDDEVDGKSDENPIYLSDVTVLEFGTLLQYLFKG